MTEPHEPRRPPGHPSMYMRWESLLFLHWPVAGGPEAIRPLVPPGLQIDTFDDRAWIGLVPFTMKGVRHRRNPMRGIPTATNFHECNVRTYVSRDGLPGVWFFSLDAASRLAVWGARSFWQLNYVHSRMALEKRSDGTIHYEVRRVKQPDVGMKCTWKSGEQRPLACPGELAHFLTERYALYAGYLKKNEYRGMGRIWHEPWPLREAEVLYLEENLIAAAGIEIDAGEAPIAYHADAIDVEAWSLKRS